MKKNYLFFVALFFVLANTLQAQQLNHLPIAFSKNGAPLTLGDFGGLNNPQFSAADLDNDGLDDLVVFDRTDNRFFTFLNNGTPNTVDYTYAPEYQKNFPEVDKWALLRDYNLDGIPDLFARPMQAIDGVAVWKGSYNAANELFFERFYIQATFNGMDIFSGVLYYRTQTNFPAVLYVTITDMPAIHDVDGDGDLDVLSFKQEGSYVVLYENQSQELGFGSDSLVFNKRTDCWGRFQESGLSNDVSLSPSIDSCHGTPYFEGKWGYISPNDTAVLQGSSRHAGSTILAFDPDKDGDTDVLLGDLTFSNLVFLENGYNADTALMVSVDSDFPSYDVPVRMDIFPAAFHLDVDNDNRKDLIVATNDPNTAENIFCAQFYKNTGTPQQDVFEYQTNDFLVGDMVDVGSGAAPAFFDYDGDGLLDLVIGSTGEFSITGISRGRLHLYKNVGSSTAPMFSLVDADYQKLSLLNVKNACPTFGDIDSDGDVDLIVGLLDGTLLYYENTAGAGNLATFAPVVTNFQGIDAGVYATPHLVDIDRDGLTDLLIGDYNGIVTFHKNSGTVGNPFFSVVTVPFPGNSIGAVDVRPIGFPRGYSAPFVLDRNGDYELFVASENGRIFHYDSIDGNVNGMFNLRSDFFAGKDEGLLVKIAIADLNNDGFWDFVIGNERGGVRFFSLDTNTVSTRTALSTDLSIRLYPNPTTDFIVLDFGTAAPSTANVLVVNTLGQVVDNHTFSNMQQPQRLVTKHLPEGIYYCHIQTEKGRQTIAFVKQ